MGRVIVAKHPVAELPLVPLSRHLMHRDQGDGLTLSVCKYQQRREETVQYMSYNISAQELYNMAQCACVGTCMRVLVSGEMVEWE